MVSTPLLPGLSVRLGVSRDVSVEKRFDHRNGAGPNKRLQPPAGPCKDGANYVFVCAFRGDGVPAGPLLSAYAFHVHPQQEGDFVGGVIATTGDLSAALDSTFDRSNVAAAPTVTFTVDTASNTRSHPIRDVALAVSFSDDPLAERVSKLAARLSSVMDNRSKPSLFMVTVHKSTNVNNRRFLIWTFPQQEVFNLSVTGSGTKLDVVEAFIRESSLRKVAFVEGPNTATGMLTARVLDFQATAIERAAADLWIVKFLNAQLQMSSSEGTRMIARALRSAFVRTTGDQTAQDQLGAAIEGLRTGSEPRVSLDQVAQGLGPVAAEALRTGLSGDMSAAMFELDRTTFDSLIHYRRFTLENGVIVSVPFADIAGVEVVEVDGKRVLKAEGEIAQEQVRTRG